MAKTGALVVSVVLQMEAFKCAPESLKIMSVSNNYKNETPKFVQNVPFQLHATSYLIADLAAGFSLIGHRDHPTSNPIEFHVLRHKCDYPTHSSVSL